MRDNITIITLAGHAPSEEARRDVEFWFARHPMVNVSHLTVDSSLAMKQARHKYKFNDLPCLVMTGDRNKRLLYYGDGIKSAIRDLREKWKHLK